MPIKIKSKINGSKFDRCPSPNTPLRSGFGQSDKNNNSGLKNLSEQRDKKKMEKKKDPSVGKGTIIFI